MASYKLNIATIRSCPPVKDLLKALDDYGLPENEPYGVLSTSSSETAVFATIARRTHQAVQKLQTETRELTSTEVEKVAVYPFAVKPKNHILEVYAGSAAAVKYIEEFMAGALGIAVATEPIELDIPAAINKLVADTQRFVLKSLRVEDYAHNSYMAGPYSPKFLDSVHGMEFLEEYSQSVTSAGVRFAGPTGRVTVTLKAQAAFSYSCNEDDQSEIQSILRKLL
ncbi:MAG: hypothetical protein ABFD92_07425 [Planctomycetaceae bacterium]|nr:hypothetical protein [Planctomycetaceae bacterium]